MALYASHRDYINSLPGSGFQIGSIVNCELEDAHGGQHLAQLAGAGTPGHPAEDLWVYFERAETYTSMVFAPSCTAEYGVNDQYDNVPCTHIAGHPGAHSWDIEPS